MDFLLQTIVSYLLLYRYLTLFAVTLLAAIALPIPSAATLMASAAFASQGYFSLTWVLVVGILGNVAGDNIGFWLARIFGKKVLLKLGYSKFVNSETILVIQQYMHNKPGLVIFFSRFEVIATLSVNFISGLSKMPYCRYLRYELLGEVVQVCVYSAIGFMFGANWQALNDIFGRFSLVITLVLALVLIFFWKKLIKQLIRSAAGK